jgi:hypothetical protein
MIVAIMFAAGLAAAPPIDATKLVLSAPAAVVEFDAGKLKGQLVRMAWSPDATVLYLQTADPDTRGNVKLRHYSFGLDGQPPRTLGEEPPWAASYWSWKSSQSAPGMSAMKIAVDHQQKRVSATSNPAGGDLAKGATEGGGAGTGGVGGGGAGGTTMGEAANAAYQSQNATVVILKLKGEVIGEFVNAPALAGTTFGWGPTGSGLVVFAPPSGRVVIMDDQARKQEVQGSKGAYLPAFTTDGKKLAYLEKSGKKKFQLKMVDVTFPAS